MNFGPAYYPYQYHDFEPPPFPNDVDVDLGSYPRHEVVQARRVLIDTVKQENNLFWRNIKEKCGILPNGQRIRQDYMPNIWLPQKIPEPWFAPISVVHVIDDDQQDGAGPSKQSTAATSSSTPRKEKNMSSCTNSPVICIDAGPEDETTEEPNYSQQSSTNAIITEQNVQDGDSEDRTLAPLSKDNGGLSDLKNRQNTSNGDTNHSEIGDCDVLDNHSTGSMQRSESESKANQSCVTNSNFSSSDEVNGNQNGKPSPVINQDNDDNDFEVWGSATVEYITMYKCDICSFTFLTMDKAQQHLNSFQHYSASSYLGRRGTHKTLCPVYTHVVSVLKCKQGLYNKVVPVCPKCYEVFPDIASCCNHTHGLHCMNGAYSLRNVRTKKTFVIPMEMHKCTECGVIFTEKSLRIHWNMTGHMPVKICRRSALEMSFFMCSLCSSDFNSFMSCRDHVFTIHGNASSNIRISMYTLEPETRIMHLLPRQPKMKQGKTDHNTINLSDATASKSQKRKFCAVEQKFKRMHSETNV